MTFQATIEYLYTRLPVFHQIGARAFKPGLHTTQALCETLGNPQELYPCIHVGGTNGKGSTSHMLAAILQKAGYKVGLYTSPHLQSFTERIRVNGLPVEESYVIDFVKNIQGEIDHLEPSFFELTVAMAFSYFATQKVDIAVIEVGMGGRLDSTNIIDPLLSVITNVSLDHTQFLGDTLAKIAIEKSGIIKTGKPVVVSQRQEDGIALAFENKAHQMQAELFFASDRLLAESKGIQDGLLHIAVKDVLTDMVVYPDLQLELTGNYQLLNVCGVLTAVERLRELGYVISQEAIELGLSRVIQLTGLKGRWQKLQDNPSVYCDTAHNYAGVSETMSQFASLPSSQQRFVIGFVGDKEVDKILKLFPSEGQYYFCQPSNPRALPAEKLAEEAAKLGIKGSAFHNVNDALRFALQESKPSDTIYVGGSTFVVADLENL
jgi:dihydrofolate synthase/folylpolyglutamate synthase